MKRLLILLTLIASLGLYAQAQRTITGTVTNSEDGSGLPGVSIVVKGTQQGIITDIDGRYSIGVPEGTVTLVFSFVGMKTKEVVTGKSTTIDVALVAEDQAIDDVVVTALGISREKKSLGYMVQEVGSEELNKASNPNIATAIQGKIAGVEVRPSSGMPGASSQIFIRGARFFAGDNNPLYVIDGLPVSSTNDYSQGVTGTDFSSRSMDIDPNDIESISVLKGQAAAALYGMRASNGVIIITTKNGKGAKGKPVVTVSTNFSSDKASRLPDLQQTYGHGSAGNLAVVNSNSWGMKIADMDKSKTVFYTNKTAADVVFDGVTIKPTEVLYLGGSNYGKTGMYYSGQARKWLPTQAYNNPEEFFETGSTINTNVNVSQSAAMGNYSIGVGNTSQTGIIPSTGMDRYSFKATGDMQMNDKWKSGFSANVSRTDINKVPSGNDSYLFGVYGAPISYDLKNIPYNIPENPFVQTSYRVGAVGDNPYWSTQNNIFNEQTRRFYGNAYLSYLPTEWLSLKYQFGGDMYETDMGEVWQMGCAKAGGALISNYAPPITNQPTGGRLVNRAMMHQNYNSLFTAIIDGYIANEIHANLLIGNEVDDSYDRYMYQQGTGLSVPGWNNMSNTTTQTATESKYYDRTVGFFANASFDYKGMLYLSATGRYDIVSTMPRDNRSFFYPSVSASWVFTELEALKSSTFLSSGKLRASYAEVGAAGSYYEPYYGLGGSGSGFITDGIGFPLGGLSGYSPTTTIYDPNLKPQNTKSYELGIALNFFMNRLGIDYSYTTQRTMDQIFAVPLAGSTGYAQEVRNAGEMSGVVHEIVFSATPVKVGKFEWQLNVNFTKSESVCESLAEGVENIFLVGFVDPNIRAYAGKTYPTIYGTSFLRNQDGKLVLDDDPESDYYGMPFAGGTNALGDVNPDFMVGIYNSFSFGPISISALLDWKQGGMMYSGSNRLIDLYGTSTKSADREATYTYEGVGYSTITDISEDNVAQGGEPITVTRGGTDDQLAWQLLHANVLSGIAENSVYETSFLKLREVAITAQLPQSLVSKLHLKGLSVSINARNFLLWTTLPNFDPESSQGTGNGQSGFDYMSLPQTKSIGGGLTITF